MQPTSPEYEDANEGDRAFLPLKTRERKIDTISTDTTTVTTTNVITEWEITPYSTADAVTQTFLKLPDIAASTSHSRSLVDFHSEIPFPHFHDILLKGHPRIDDEARSIIQNEQYITHSKDYQRALGQEGNLKENPPDPAAARSSLMVLFNHVIESAFSSHTTRDPSLKRDVRFLQLEDEHLREGLLNPCVAVCRNGVTTEPTWANCLMVMDVDTAAYENPVNPPISLSINDPTPTAKEEQKLTTAEPAIVGSKRSRDSAGPSIEEPPAKRVRQEPSSPQTTKPTQEMPSRRTLVAHASEVFSAVGNRRHILGLAVSRTSIRFWYFDRVGTVCSSPLDIEKDAIQLVASLITLCYCDEESLGLEPFLRRPPLSKHSFGSITSSQLHLQGRTFAIKQALAPHNALFGWGTTVYAGRGVRVPGALEGYNGAIPSRVVVKLSWQPVNSGLEHVVFKAAEEKGIKGFAKLYTFEVMDRLSLGLRGKLVAPDTYLDRELRVQIMTPPCKPLSEVRESANLKSAFTSLLQAHRDLFEKTGSLIQDINPSDLVVDKNDPNSALFVNLDSVVSPGDESRGPLSPDTIPFRALDRLQDDPPIGGLYRHGLESFFYVLIWISEHSGGASSKRFASWHTGQWSDMIAAKRAFLFGDNSLLPSAPFRIEGLAQLRNLFADGYRAQLQAEQDGKGADFDKDSLGSHITYEKFMEALQVI